MTTSAEILKAQFAGFELDLSSGELVRDGHVVRLQNQPFLVLRLLLEHAGEVVTREELQHRIWSGETFVDFDHGLNKTIAKLREALDDSKAISGIIQTLPRRGYRFTAEVTWIGPRNGASSPTVPAVSHRTIPLQYWLGGGLVLAVLLSAVLWANRNTVEDWLHSRPVIESVAVLPVVNVSNDPEQEYLANGITEEIAANLSYARSLRVVSRSSTRRYKNSPLSLPQIAEQLKVDAVIEGTVLRANDTIRITIRLVAARPERLVWTASYERNMRDVANLPHQIAADTVAQIRTQLAPDEESRLKLESRISPEAYDEYLRARFFLGQETTQEDKAIPHLERAIQLDPNFAAAYAALGEAWGVDGVWGEMGNRETSAKALAYSQKAVSLDPNSSEAYASLGHSLMQAHRWNDGETALRRAIQLDSNNFRAMDYLALLLAQKARAEEAVVLARAAADANPVSVDIQRIYAVILYRAGRYDDAIEQCQRVIHLDPNHLATYGTLGHALAEKGRYQQAEDAFRQEKASTGTWAWLSVREGNLAAARQFLQKDSSVSPPGAVARYLLGEQTAGLAELDYLANEKWATRTYNLRNDPLFAPLRSDPRFTAIVKKTGLLDN